MEYKKAGDCLSYALGNELIRSEETSDKYNLNLKAFITFFALKKYISKETAAMVQKIIDKEATTISQKKDQFVEMSKLIINDLKNTIRFKDFDHLVEILNEIEIPSWVFQTEGLLIKMFPEVYLISDWIYYMINDEGKRYFRCIHLNKIEEILDFSKDYSESFDSDNYTISTKYYRVLGFNEESMTFFLDFRYTNNMYTEYHADTKQEVIIHYRCFGVLNNKFPVIQAKNDLAVVIGKEIKKIREIDTREDYKVKDGCIYVYPTYNIPIMFRPYMLMLDGSRVELSQNYAVAYVMEKIQRDIRDYRSILIKNEANKLMSGEYKEDIVFTLDYLDQLLVGRYDLEKNKEARTYHFIIKLLANYLPMDKDVLEYFFVLSDVSKRLSKERNYSFIGEGIYWLLNELHLKGKLSIIKDINKFRATLLQYVYWNDEIIRESNCKNLWDRYVGYFTITKGKIKANKENVKNAIYIGDMVLAKWQDMPGIVAFNLESGAYEIQYNRLLTGNEVQMIIDAYDIDDNAYCVHVDNRQLLY